MLVGQTIDLLLPELGASGPAKIIAIEACPPIEVTTDPLRRIVTATFHHSSGDLLDVVVEGESQSLGVTDNHPFWSVDRQAFVPAGELQVGERLRRADSTTARIAKLTPRRGPPTPVYNLEVDAQHVYYVGKNGLLVHNSYQSQTGFVYRALAEGDDIAQGLRARSPSAGNTVSSHVAGKRLSQWISTSKSKTLVVEKFVGDNGIVRINLGKIGSDIQDISEGIPNMDGTMLSNWAKKYEEVLIRDYIPPDAIETITDQLKK